MIRTKFSHVEFDIMIMIEVSDVIRDILGASRVQFLRLPRPCTNPEAAALDFRFREQLFEDFDYSAFVEGIMDLVPEEGAIDYKDDYGLHYLVYPGRDAEAGSYCFCGPYLHHPCGEETFRELIGRHGLSPDAIEALRWYFRRIPVVQDVVSWRQMFSMFLARYFADPDFAIRPVSYHTTYKLKEKPAVALSSIPYASIEARYATEAKMLDAIRRGDISEATYQQNLFMGFSLDQRISDPLRNGKNMVIAASAAMRKAVQQAEVHPLYIDGLSGQFLQEIEAAENEAQLSALVPRMIPCWAAQEMASRC